MVVSRGGVENTMLEAKNTGASVLPQKKGLQKFFSGGLQNRFY